MKRILFLMLLVLVSCSSKKPIIQFDKQPIHNLIDQWHKDVAEFNYNAYFDKMTADAVFVGTDASEVWSKNEFQSFSKPFFDKKQTWNFKPLIRNIYYNKQQNIVWFNETLDTWMGVCRGSGVVVLVGDTWKIQQYVLSIVVPNDVVKDVVKTKKKQDAIYINAVNNYK